MPSRGYTAIWAEPARPQSFARTLAHELTHVVHRRALGGDLPRWLSEGLADAIGDTATGAGIGTLEGLEGSEGIADRLLLGVDAGRAQSRRGLVS